MSEWRTTWPGCNNETPFEVVEETAHGKLFRCTDCGKVCLDLPVGALNRHEKTCPRIPYLLGQKQGITERVD